MLLVHKDQINKNILKYFKMFFETNAGEQQSH